MSKSEKGGAVRLLTASAGAFVVAAGALSLFHMPVETTHPKNEKRAFASISIVADQTDTALRDQALLSDPVPLFLPTPWNYEQTRLPNALEKRPEKEFDSFEPKFRFPEDRLNLGLHPIAKVPDSPFEVVQQQNKDPFMGLGRNEQVPLPAIESRDAFIEVIQEGTGKQAIRPQTLTHLSIPNRNVWAPIEYLAAVKADGLLGQLMVSEHKGLPGDNSDEIDAYFREFLSKTFHLGERLEPGLYRVIIGP